MELIPAELSRIFQKLSYKSTIDNSRLYNTLKKDFYLLKETGVRTIDKYMLRDKGVCKFNKKLDNILKKFKQNEYYESNS